MHQHMYNTAYCPLVQSVEHINSGSNTTLVSMMTHWGREYIVYCLKSSKKIQLVTVNLQLKQSSEFSIYRYIGCFTDN